MTTATVTASASGSEGDLRGHRQAAQHQPARPGRPADRRRQGEPLGEHGTGCLEPGEVFEVDAKVAGRPPSGDAGLEDDYDPGEGLLAQVGNYELADGPPKKPRRSAAEARQEDRTEQATRGPDAGADAADTVTEV
jgi:hypothetical protein